LKNTSEISSEKAAEFGFFPVSTKMKAQRACANIFRGLKSYIFSFLYLFVSFLVALFCCCGKTQGKIYRNRWKYLCSGNPDSFEEISLVSACHQNVLEIKGHQSPTFG